MWGEIGVWDWDGGMVLDEVGSYVGSERSFRKYGQYVVSLQDVMTHGEMMRERDRRR
jgi:hypothetical protein